MPENRLMPKAPAAILLDMDGVLYHGDKALPMAIEFMQLIREIPHCFITNNPILLPPDMADKLEKQGFNRPHEQQIVSSGEATAIWLSRQKPDFNYFCVGARGVHQALQQFGQYNEKKADFVVIGEGEGEGLDYEKLTIGINLILKNNAKLISTNPDHTVDAFINNQHTILPGGGALVAPFVAATGQHPITIGKPNPLLYEIALDNLGIQAENCLMIGDRPDTDILGAKKLGMQTALVRTGRFAPGEALPANAPAADVDVDDLNCLIEKLRQNYPDWI